VFLVLLQMLWEASLSLEALPTRPLVQSKVSQEVFFPLPLRLPLSPTLIRLLSLVALQEQIPLAQLPLPSLLFSLLY
jgi:hypothetical protein